MDSQENLFEAPKAQLEMEGTSDEAKVPVYSPNQVTTGTFLGGPLTGTYFLHANFKALGNDDAARKALIGGVLFTAILGAVIPFLPKAFPNYPIPILYTMGAQWLAKSYQMKKPDIAASTRFGFESNWKVVLASLIGFIVFMILVIAEVYTLISVNGRL